MFANHVSDKGLLSRIYKELVQLNNKKTNQLEKKMGERFAQTFLQRADTNDQMMHEKMVDTISH